jgi:formate dehydrogenase subunit delta
MATDIAAQFHQLPDEEAVAAVLTHLHSFWAPSMRAQLAAVAEDPPPDLDPLVLRAARRLADERAPS